MFDLSRIIEADDVKWSEHNIEKINNRWHVAKPLRFSCICILARLKLSFLIFIGKYDVLKYKVDN